MPSLHRILRSALRLERRSRGHAARALAWLVVARVVVRVVPYAVIRRAVSRLPPRRAYRAGMTAAECARALDRAVTLLPGTRCLARAIAAECLLRRDGHPARLSLGVSLDDPRRLHAHAWIDSQGVAVSGGDEAARYSPLGPSDQS